MLPEGDGAEESGRQQPAVEMWSDACPGVAAAFGQALVASEAVGPGVGNSDADGISPLFYCFCDLQPVVGPDRAAVDTVDPDRGDFGEATEVEKGG